MTRESKQVQALKERYRASFGEKVDVLKTLLLQVNQNEGVEGVLRDGHETLHKLAGSLGMYGYDEIALICRDAMAHAKQSEIEPLNTCLERLIELLESEA